jgi:hypothetical protein
VHSTLSQLISLQLLLQRINRTAEEYRAVLGADVVHATETFAMKCVKLILVT